MEKLNIYQKLIKIQSELKVPKNQKNTFGNYYYRNCEDILEEVKPLLLKYELILTISDEIIFIEDTVSNQKILQNGDKIQNSSSRFYVKATAILTDGEKEIKTNAYAREAESKKGMDESQLTGATSSYARKYALNGLFCIDDTKDSDTTNTHDKEPIKTNTTDTIRTEYPKKSASKEQKAEGDNCSDCENTVNILTSKAGKKYWKCKNCGAFGFEIKTKDIDIHTELDEEIPF